MAVKIVDEFEEIQVHENKGKGARGGGGALPFSVESFHEETVRFDTSQAVGDGLFAGLLEGFGIVQSAGDEVSEGADEQNFFLGKFDVGRGLDEKYAVKVLGIKDRESHGRSSVGQKRL